MSFAFTGIFTFLVDAYPRYAASALAANALVRCSFAGKSQVNIDPGVCVVYAALGLSVCVLVTPVQQRPGHASAVLPFSWIFRVHTAMTPCILWLVSRHGILC
ncbi:hypothetical protein B0T09DRAFT_147488 [Sordaria sp. MPI-SDFR-AT-0083]|nr:hypothetical protein B0T09DRAFT_147488 [Sordaria sp. MPI-SDFR-AT-0083]